VEITENYFKDILGKSSIKTENLLSWDGIAIIQVPKNKIANYHSFFNVYEYGQNLIDSMNFLSEIDLWVDDTNSPSVLKFSIPYFHIFAGNPNNPITDQLFEHIKERTQFIFPNQSWEGFAQNYFGNKLRSYERSRFDPSNLELSYIQKFNEQIFPEGYVIQEINFETADYIDKKISNYFSLFFGGPSEFLKTGVGYCIKEGSELASFATAFLPFDKNLEMQVITLKNYRRKGFALRVCAKLIEFCLKNGITPCWDAANEQSANLALKLGYTDPISYKCYYWQND
jgi:hypothetical protein